MSSSQKLLALLVGACLVSLIAADYKCTPDKKWHECACNKDHYCGGKGPGCTYGCKEGCVCKDPKHRLHDNACIPADKCPGNCPQGAEWQKCSGCKDHNCGGNYVDCKIRCNPGCVCNNPKYRLHDNKCIPADKCPGNCPQGAEWQKCSGCKDHNCGGKGMDCTHGCDNPGCVCNNPKYRLHNNECIPADKCPDYCPPDMVWSDCSGCKDECQGNNVPCTTKCEKRCVCKASGYKLRDNKCIPEATCPGNCPSDMMWSDCCGCNDECQKKGIACKAGCTKGCKCKDSEHRLQDNKCIHHTKCPGYCPSDMVWSDCAGCHHYCGGEGMSCLAVCEKRCVCKNKDYKLQGNKCIPDKECRGKCPTDMVWSDCCGCNDSCPKKGIACKAVCTKGCKCKDPEHRLQDNKCVHHKKCPPWGGYH